MTALMKVANFDFGLSQTLREGKVQFSGTYARKGVQSADSNKHKDVKYSEKLSLRGILQQYQIDLSELSMHFSAETRVGFGRQLKSLLDESEWDELDRLPDRGAF